MAVEAFDFDITLNAESVLLSFYLGGDYDVSQFIIYHSDNGTEWTEATISNLSYDGSYLSFSVDGFSSYGYALTSLSATSSTTPVPEPSTYAMIVGLLSLGFVAYRRRK